VYSKLGNAQIYFFLGWLVLLSYCRSTGIGRGGGSKFAGAVKAQPGFAAGPSTPIHGK